MWSRERKLILSCEHGGYYLPSFWKSRVKIPQKILESHRGWDPGAIELTRELVKAGAHSTSIHQVSRLLIELNRSKNHPDLFSQYSIQLPLEMKRELLHTIYLPYRSRVKASISQCKDVVHLSVHSFTPILKGKKREAEVGILYDPSKKNEKLFAKAWQSLLRDSLGAKYRIRMNYPYRGISDGFTTSLRKLFTSDRYIGIELEVNQALYSTPERWKRVGVALRKTLSLLMQRKL